MAKRMAYRTLMKKVDAGDIEIERWNSETEQDGSIYAQVFHNDMSNAGKGKREEIKITKAPSDVTGKNARLILSWYKMEATGRYEVTGYIS